MADTARGQVSMTPIVTITADSDSDSVDAIHHDIGGSVGGKLEYIDDQVSDRWYYDAETNVTGSADLISGNFTDAAIAVAPANDLVRFLSITHTGKDVSGDATEVEVHFCFDGTDPTGAVDALMIGASESCIIKTAGDMKVQDLQVASADASSVVCKVVAMLKDV